ncbi:MAG: phosphate ABC transporter substrate-binding/OmpA family protein [Betaproteobacteria bacterium]|nr:phosphate ABC transporter substrate-binding/OmpA family protein [Betaproteobacteria bacterium]
MSSLLEQYQNKGTAKLTKFAWFCIFVLVALLAGAVVWFVKPEIFANVTDAIKGKSDPEAVVMAPAPSAPSPEVTKRDNNKQVVISLDEWIGWKPIFDANGGVTTAKGSIFDKLGLNVKLVVINDAAQSSNALISGNVTAAGYTLNRLAYLMDKFDRANMQVVVPFLCNNSAGGDGIIAKKSIKSVEDLKGKTIVAPRFSEAQTLVYWFLYNSNLTPSEMSDITSNMILVNTPDEAAKVFFAGKADAAATWQPFLDQANDPNANTHTLVTTKQATNLILDVIVFRKDFYEKNKEWVSRFADGVFQAHRLYKTKFDSVRGMPMMNGLSDSEIAAMADDAALANYAKNVSSLERNGVGPKVFQDMLGIWKRIGEPAKVGNYEEIFDLSALKLLEPQYGSTTLAVPTFTQEQRQVARAKNAIMTRSLSIEFEVNSAVFKNPSAAQGVLDDIVNQLNIVDNAVVQIEGNTSSEGARNINIELSNQRANAVAKYLTRYGINPSRFVVVGNGPDKPMANNSTPEGRQKNRRTDIMIKAGD